MVMKFPMLLIAVVLAFSPIARAETPARPATRDTYANPLDVLLADPFIYHEGKTYYLYATAAGDGLLVWTSENLVDWQLRGHAFRRTRESWSRQHFWAPELFKHNGKYYLHYTAVGGEGDEPKMRRIVLSESDSPLGPFKESKAPWFDPKQSTIDSHVFKDDDGQLYLYSVYTGELFERKFQINVRKLDKDLNPSKDVTICISPSLPWEGNYVNEGPFVLKHNGLYVLTYSANGYHDPNYCVGFATSKSPLGPWTKFPDRAILHKTKTVSGPGHHCFIDSPDGKELFIAYHTHQFVKEPGPPRQLAIDRVKWIDGPKELGGFRMEVGPATDSEQPMPSGDKLLVRGQSDEFNKTDLDRARWTVFSEDPRHWKLDAGKLTIQTDDGDVFEARSDLSNLFLQYAPRGDFEVTTKVSINPEEDYQQAYITLWQDHNNFAKIAFLHTHGAKMIEVGVEQQEKYVSHLHETKLTSEAWLKIRKKGNVLEFLASSDGKKWDSIETQTVPLIDLRVGFGASSPDAKKSTTAEFDFFRIAAK